MPSWKSLWIVTPSSSRTSKIASGMSYSTSNDAVGVVGPDARQPQALGLVAGVEVVLRVVDRVEPDHCPCRRSAPVKSITWSWNQKKLCFSRSSLPAGQFRYSWSTKDLTGKPWSFGPNRNA